jgi:hypothetical protein
MNSHNFSANELKTVPAEYVPPMSLHRFCEITSLSKASAWRLRKTRLAPNSPNREQKIRFGGRRSRIQ